MATSQADGGTRSGLLWEVERILDELNREREHSTLPQVLLMENVPEVIGAGNVKHFNKWLLKLESLGYSNYFQILNGKDYCIPQNRRRCFMVSILGDYAYDFPLKHKLKYRLKDFLCKSVDEKYYLTEKMVDYVLARTPLGDKEFKSANNIRSVTSDKTAGTITTKGSGTGSSCRGEDTFIVDDMTQEQIDTMIYGKSGGGLMIKENNSVGYKIATPGDGVNLNSRMKHQRGNVQKGSIQTLKTQMEVGVVVDEQNKNKDS